MRAENVCWGSVVARARVNRISKIILSISPAARYRIRLSAFNFFIKRLYCATIETKRNNCETKDIYWASNERQNSAEAVVRCSPRRKDVHYPSELVKQIYMTYFTSQARLWLSKSYRCFFVSWAFSIIPTFSSSSEYNMFGEYIFKICSP